MTLARRASPSPVAGQASSNPKAPKECLLFMECEDEPLSEAQQNAHDRQNAQFREQMAKLEEMAKAGAKVTHHDNGSVSFRVTESSVVGTSSSAITIASSNSAPSVTPVMQPPVATSGSNYRLLMDPRTGRILGTINGTGGAAPAVGNVLRPVAPPPNIRHLTPVPKPVTLAPLHTSPTTPQT